LFIDIDYNKRKQEAKLELAKPNKRIVDVIWEKFNDNMSIKLGNINELNFSIPYFIEDDGEQVENPHVTSIKEKMLVRITLGSYKEWYIVDSIEEDAEDSSVFNVKAYSLGYELKGKRVSDYTEDTINATNLLTTLLSSTIWKIGTVDPMFDAMFRSFDSGSDSNVLDCVTNAGETFGALIVWDTAGRKISFKDASQNGTFKGMTVDYGRFLNSIKRTRTTDEMVTRMYVEGADGLSIQTKNPTGQRYIENFGYFMFPFVRDSNRNVVSHSDFMSDELCHALLDQQDAVDANSFAIQDLQGKIATDNTQMVTEQSKLSQLNGDMTTIQGLLDTANASGDQALITQRTNDKNAKQTEIQQQQLVVTNLQAKINGEQSQLNALLDDISMEKTFTQELFDELNLYIIESIWRDDRYIDETELYNDAVKKFDEIRQPKVVIDVTIENLLNIIEEQYYWDKIVLGDLIKVRYPQMNIEYMAKIIQIDYNLADSEISLTIANTTDLLSETDKLVQLLYNSSNASTTIASNKYKWDKVSYVQDQVSQLVSSEWDATKNEIIAGVNNSVVIGNRGIMITNPDIPDDVVIMQAGVIALSKDGGETWHTAVKPDGIVAERLIGRLIAGEELLITNSYGSFTFDNTGVHINANAFVVSSSSGDNLVQQWSNASDFVNSYTDDSMITPYEKRGIKTEWDRIAVEYTKSTETIDGYYDATEKATLQWVTDFNSSYTNLYNYLFVTNQDDGFPLLDNGGADNTTRIDATLYKSKFDDYYTDKSEVDKQLALKAKQVADDAQSNLDGVKDDIVYNTELHSTKGDLFSNGHIDTTLFVVVYKGKNNITDTLPNSAFIWRKTDEDGIEDLTFKSAHANVGKTIQVTKDDVYKKAVFWCDIDIPDA
jgi:hypothetical protein